MSNPSLEHYRLYFVTDRFLNKGYSVIDQVRLAIKGGVKVIQLREKEIATSAFIDLAREALKITLPAGAFLIINDRVDVVLASGANGVHLGQDDMKLEDARKLLGRHKIIGISARSKEEARDAEKAGADYIAVSGIFPTDTKKDIGESLGLESVKIMRKATTLPLIAIGGIKVDNCADVIKAGADGVAVITGITMSDDIPATCAEFLRNIRKSLTGKDK